MRERVEQMNGELEITSGPEKGTKIVIALLADRSQDAVVGKKGHNEGR
jgi:nitrate/nitrite-specific signal transduction histidine kinase